VPRRESSPWGNFRASHENAEAHYDLRKFSFTSRIVNIWNSLPNAVVDVNLVEVFKSRRDNFGSSKI